MNYLEIELSLRTWTILGGVSTVGILLLAVWLAYRYSKAKNRRAATKW